MTSRRKPPVRRLGTFKFDNYQKMRREKDDFRKDLQELSNMLTTDNSVGKYGKRSSIKSNGYLANQRSIVNDASKAVYYNKIRDRVSSANTSDRFDRLRFSHPLCGRCEASCNKGLVRGYQCEVLGTSYCTDCIQLKRRIRSADTQRSNFPDVDISPRSLVAPVRLEKVVHDIAMSLNSLPTYAQRISPELYVHNFQTCGQVVYTQNDVYNRLRDMHREHGHILFGQDDRKIPTTAGLTPEGLFKRVKNKQNNNLEDIKGRPHITFKLPTPKCR